MISIGINNYPTFPAKNLHTLIRFGAGSNVITFGKNVRISQGCGIVVTRGAKLVLGDNFFANQYTILQCANRIEMESNVRLGWCVQVYDTDVHYMVNNATGEVYRNKNIVVIGHNSWIANHATISKGSIPPFSVVASHALVNKDYSNLDGVGHMFYGIPAKHKQTDNFRILNETIEFKLDSYFKSHPECDSLNIINWGCVVPIKEDITWFN